MVAGKTDRREHNNKRGSVLVLEAGQEGGKHKVLHAEPLYIDLIRDLGARKGEAEWNVEFGLFDNYTFDVYKDAQDNISTLTTESQKIKNLRETYSQLHTEVVLLLRTTSFSSKNKKYFARFINLIICRGYVCLECLEENEVKTQGTQGIFLLDQYSRKDLICDMEKPVNMISAFDYFAKSRVEAL